MCMSRVIKGTTRDGQKFRPSQWAEMMVHGAETHDGKICIEVCPVKGKCIRICKSIDGSDESERLLQFALDNNLEIEDEKRDK